MRGEHSSSAATIATAVGSSPHARGAPVNLVVLQLHQGIIPACAGSTPSCTDASRPRRDHPRMRGEHIVRHPVLSIVRGSSPHARGALVGFARAPDCDGIIPACAGSTACAPTPCGTRWDHPRMRGEHLVMIWTTLGMMGSSPHARGAPQRPAYLGCLGGIIPACAGSTRAALRAARRRRDHPRMRGEHFCLVYFCRRASGSSPHARGARVGVATSDGVQGIIPACAGSTLEYLRLCPGLKRITLTLPITSEADKRTEKHPNHQLMPRAFRPSRRHCRAGCGPIHCLTPRTSWPSCTCLPCSSPFSSCRQASRHPCPSAS